MPTSSTGGVTRIDPTLTIQFDCNLYVDPVISDDVRTISYRRGDNFGKVMEFEFDDVHVVVSVSDDAAVPALETYSELVLISRMARFETQWLTLPFSVYISMSNSPSLKSSYTDGGSTSSLSAPSQLIPLPPVHHSLGHAHELAQPTLSSILWSPPVIVPRTTPAVGSPPPSLMTERNPIDPLSQSPQSIVSVARVIDFAMAGYLCFQ